MSFVAAWIFFLVAITGGFDEPLHQVPRTAAGTGGGDVQGLPRLEPAPTPPWLGEGAGSTAGVVVRQRAKFTLPVFGLAGDGVEKPTRTPPPTPESIVIVPVATVAPVCEWECILRSVGWPDYAIADALRISWCESGWRDVQNARGGPYWGRFQIAFTGAGYHQDKLIALGYPATTQALLDPYINARVALLIWQEQGWTPWECK